VRCDISDEMSNALLRSNVFSVYRDRSLFLAIRTLSTPEWIYIWSSELPRRECESTYEENPWWGRHQKASYRREVYRMLSNWLCVVRLVMAICWLKNTRVLIRIVPGEETLWSTTTIMKLFSIHYPILIWPSYITVLRQRQRTYRFSRSPFYFHCE
jgi:hypothetical protein